MAWFNWFGRVFKPRNVGALNYDLSYLKTEIVRLQTRNELLERLLIQQKTRNSNLEQTLGWFTPKPSNEAEKFREEIFEAYGFTEFAKFFIRAFSKVELLNANSNAGGGGWRYWDNTVILNTKSHEAAIHELSHSWQWAMRAVYPDMYRKRIAEDVVHYASDLAWKGTEFQEFCRVYVNGDPQTGFKGMFPGVNDIWNITQQEWDTKVLDWEIYAGLASWCMLQYRTGPRVLPAGMWKYFEKLGTGDLKVMPYYQGGPK